jgi:peptidoglycan/LPS O-acetylase OafA/YrhL
MGILRFLLALAVASGHASGFFGLQIHPIMAGSRAVQIFYMISGFLIALILSGKYADTPQGNWIFYSNRAVKIFVPYLAILAATICLWLGFGAVTGTAVALDPFFSEAPNMSLATWAFAILTNLFLIGQEWSAMLIYRGGELIYSLHAIEQAPSAIQFEIIVPAWTLSLELMFYLIAPFILRRNFLLIAGLALTSYIARFQAYKWGYYSQATDYRFFPFELSLFLYGALSYRYYLFLKARDLLKPHLALAITIACALAAISLPRYFNQHPHQMYALMGFLLPALFDFSTRHRFDKWLGDLSYPLYLVHWPVCLSVLTILKLRAPGEVGTNSFYPYLAVVVSIGLAVAINHLLVYPIDRWRQDRARRATILAPEHPVPQPADSVSA